jgi:hypothetical protein
MSPTAFRTARRNRVQRIDRFVSASKAERFKPGPDAIANLEVVLECLVRAQRQARLSGNSCPPERAKRPTLIASTSGGLGP